MGLKKSRLREICKVFFVENLDVTQKEVSETYGVTEKTISKWSKEDEWEESRRDHYASPIKIKKLLQEDIFRMARGEEPLLNSDKISKHMSALDRCEKKLDPVVVAKLLKELDNFISKINPVFATEATVYHKQFLQHRIGMEA